MSRNFLITVLLVAGIFLTAGIATTFAQNSSRTLSISSTKDKQDLRASSEIVADVGKSGTVYFHASGYQTFEPVTLSIETADTQSPIKVLVAQWQAVADENGRFDAVWFSGTYDSRMLVTASGQNSGSQSEAIFYVSPDVVTAVANLDQCANGPVGSPPVVCSGAAWQNGNLNQNQAHYMEGDSVAYRLTFIGMAVGSTNTVTIEWDAIEGGHHALDYVTTFDASETGADPCSGVPNCDLATGNTYPIPVDPMVTVGFDGVLGTPDDIAQLPGDFTIYGGTITGVSTYTYSTSSGKDQTSITITFTATKATPVLAWGGHIATRADWGVNNSAIALSGSPFHMRLLDVNGSGGNQDRSLSNEAAVFPAEVMIVKLVNNLNGTHSSTFAFGFTSSANFGLTSFTLVDNDPTATGGGSLANAQLVHFGAANAITVTEDLVSSGRYTLSDLSCTEVGAGKDPVINSTWNFLTRTATIIPDEGEVITCTYTNAEQAPTAANVAIGGRITDQNGFGVRNAVLYMTGTDGSGQFVAISNGFGYYEFTEIPVGVSYVLSLSAKGYTFNPPSVIVSPKDAISDLDFQATGNLR